MTMEPESHGRVRRQGPAMLRGRAIPKTTTDQRLLDRRGPSDWVHTDPWRVLRIQAEFVEGFGLLAETGKITRFPIGLVGSSYWSGLLAWLRDVVCGEGKVSPGDLDLLSIADDPDEVARIIRTAHGNQPGGELSEPGWPAGEGRTP